MNHEHEKYADWAGAYALGSLEPDERRSFERHLETCQICEADVRAFAPLPGLLGHIDSSELVAVADEATAAAIVGQASHELAVLRRSRRRWRWFGAAAAAVAFIVTVGTIVVFDGAGPNEESRGVQATIVSSTAESTTIATLERGWGTQIELELAGLPPRDTYQVWAIDAGGTWSTAATWGPTASGGARITGATAIATPDLRRIVVTSGDRAEILVDAAT